MRVVLVAMMLLAVPALARERRGRTGVVVDKELVQQQLSDADTTISNLMARLRRDREGVKVLKQLREQLQDLNDYMDDAPPAPREIYRWDEDEKRPPVIVVPPVVLPTQLPGPQGNLNNPNPGPIPPSRNPGPSYPPPQQQPQQPQQPMVYPIADQNMQNLLGAMNRESFPNDRLRVLGQAAPVNYFLVAQVQQILSQFNFPKDRLQAMRILKPRILDTENYYQLYSSFEFPADKNELKKILSQ